MESTEIINQLQREARQMIDQLKKTEVWVGVCGAAGSGKSSFINAIRGINDASHPYWAPTGAKETTLKPKHYPDPFNHLIVYIDLPGVGTLNFPEGQYEEKVKLSDYDVYIIAYRGRFTQYEESLANIITGYNKKFFFVRTMFDEDNKNRMIDSPQKTEDELMEELRGEALRNHKHSTVYMISNRPQYRENWHFPFLCHDILCALTEHKKNAMTMYMRTTSKEIIQRKYEVMNGRIKYYAVLSSIGACAPVPGLSFVLDLALIIYMAKEFQNGFGLTEDHLKNWGIIVNATMKDILVATSALVTSEALTNLIKQNFTALTVEEISRMIPIFGTLIAAGISYGCTYYMGIFLLDKMKTAAEELASLVVDSLKQTGEVF